MSTGPIVSDSIPLIWNSIFSNIKPQTKKKIFFFSIYFITRFPAYLCITSAHGIFNFQSLLKIIFFIFIPICKTITYDFENEMKLKQIIIILDFYQRKKKDKKRIQKNNNFFFFCKEIRNYEYTWDFLSNLDFIIFLHSRTNFTRREKRKRRETGSNRLEFVREESCLQKSWCLLTRFLSIRVCPKW